MQWLTLLGKLPTVFKVLKEAKEAFVIIKARVDDPEVHKEIDDVYKAISELTG